MNLCFDLAKANIGDCFVYQTDRDKIVGFILENIEKNKNRVEKLRFCIVDIIQSTDIDFEDFKNGQIYTHKVYQGLNGDFKTGIQCYDFYPTGFEIFKKFKFVANIQLDQAKYTYGGGWSFADEFFFNVDLNNIELTSVQFEKKNLDSIMQ